MYNDYYLQEISGKITTTNNKLDSIITNQETIITNQEVTYNTLIGLEIVIALILCYLFVVRCLKN